MEEKINNDRQKARRLADFLISEVYPEYTIFVTQDENPFRYVFYYQKHPEYHTVLTVVVEKDLSSVSCLGE